MKRAGGQRERYATPTNNTLFIGTLNIQSSKPELLELSIELQRHDFDVVLLSET